MVLAIGKAEEAVPVGGAVFGVDPVEEVFALAQASFGIEAEPCVHARIDVLKAPVCALLEIEARELLFVEGELFAKRLGRIDLGHSVG